LNANPALHFTNNKHQDPELSLEALMNEARPIVRGYYLFPWALIAGSALLFCACAPSVTKTSPLVSSNETKSPGVNTAIPTIKPAVPTTLPSPQPTAASIYYGPNPENFPPGINPLTGEPAIDPTLLKIPALLVSVSNFPVTARPQAGLSFAPFVYEFSITEGQSRFLATFYGQYPESKVPVTGDCVIRSSIFKPTGTIIGNRVWLDTNKNGIQDPGEEGIGGICVNLYDSHSDLLQSTTTDSNGYYGFNVEKGQTYTVGFVKPAYMDFTFQNAGDDSHDSDADPATGRTGLIIVNGDSLSWDAGLYPNGSFTSPTPDLKNDPKPEVGPVRSGRLLYSYIGGFYQNSCLIDAFASPEVLVKIPHCAYVAHENSGGGSMLEIDRMRAIAEENMAHTTNRPFNYTSNVFSDKIPTGGVPASQINIFFAYLNQSGWSYDPLYQAYLRFVDNADKNNPGVLHADTDRLTGRQLYFENVIVIMADTDVVSPTNLDIHLDEGNTGYAYLFRDGQMFPIKWSTRAGVYEKQTGFRRPIQFLNNDGTPAALRPGHTWVTIITPFSTVQTLQPGVYSFRYAAPEGEAR
jgi:hypothetical protein